MGTLHHQASRAFTLVEILLVVVILGILAAIIVPQFASASAESRRAAFVTELRVFVGAAEHFTAREGTWVSDGGSGVCPDEFRDYIDDEDFESGTPLDGVWDFERDESGVTSAVGVHFNDAGEAKDDAYMTLVDAIFDDGDLNTGIFQKLENGRYYAIIEE